MALYNVSILKHRNNDHTLRWANDYHIDASSIVQAQTRAGAIADLEAAILWDNYSIYQIRVKGATGGAPGLSENVYIPGTRGAGDPTVQLPLFNTVLYQFIPGQGRPSLKYLRGVLVEGDVSGFNVISDTTDFISSTYAAPLVALGYLRDESGQTMLGYGFKTAVQMRQLGWHRRTRVGYHRGWVPNA